MIRARGTILDTSADGAYHHITCEIPTAELPAIEQQLPGLTRGEGNWTSSFARYVPVTGEPPTRERSGPDPRDRTRFLAELARG